MDRLYDIGKKDFESVYDDLVDDFIREYREQIGRASCRERV